MKRNTIINPSRRVSLSPPRTEVNTARASNRDYRNLVNATDYDNLVQNRSNAEIREILHQYRTANNIRPIVPIISRNFVDDIDLEVSGLTNSQIIHAVRQGERSLRNRNYNHINRNQRQLADAITNSIRQSDIRDARVHAIITRRRQTENETTRDSERFGRAVSRVTLRDRRRLHRNRRRRHIHQLERLNTRRRIRSLRNLI